MKLTKKVLMLLALSALLLCAACGAEADQPQEEAPQIEDEMPQEPTEPEFDPESEEFSLHSASGHLQLGEQTGAFPWESGLEQQEIYYSSSDGFDLFDILCTDGTALGGLRQEGVETEDGGTLSSVETANPDFATLRGASVGMSQEEVLALYPEAKAVELSEPVPGGAAYEFSGEQFGMSSILFRFQDGVLANIRIENLVC